MKHVLTLAAFLAAGLFAGLAHAKDLTYSTFTDPKSTNNTLGVLPFFEHVKQDTKGALNWKFYPSGQLLAARATLAGIRDGVANAGFIVPTYNQSELPNNVMLANMVNSGSNIIAVTGAINETIILNCPECQNDYKKNNAIFLGGHVTTPYEPLCKKPFDGHAGIKGLKVKSVGSYSRILQEMGAVPVNIPTDEMAEALERGQIDCVLGPIPWLENYQLKDNVRFVMDASFGLARGMGLFVMNLDSWKGLGKTERSAMLKHMGELVAGAIKGYVDEDAKARSAAAKMGITFAKPDAKLEAELKPTKAFTDENIKRAKEIGSKNPEKVLEAFNKSLAKWEKLAPAIGNDTNKLADVLYREIYSKVTY